MKRVGSIWYFKGKNNIKPFEREWIIGGSSLEECFKSFISYYKI